MKGNNGSGNTEDRDDWQTPNELFGKLNQQYNFKFDCCANKHNSKCGSMFAEDFIEYSSIGVCVWMNPPFSKALQMFEHYFKVIIKGVSIYRCDNMETKVWQEQILKYCDWIFIPKGRIDYSYNPELRKGKGTRFPSALIGIGVDPPKNIQGVVLYLNK